MFLSSLKKTPALAVLLFTVACTIPSEKSEHAKLDETAKKVADLVIKSHDKAGMAAVCKGGRDTIKPAIVKAVTTLMVQQEIEGDPNAIGESVGRYLWFYCNEKV